VVRRYSPYRLSIFTAGERYLPIQTTGPQSHQFSSDAGRFEYYCELTPCIARVTLPCVPILQQERHPGPARLRRGLAGPFGGPAVDEMTHYAACSTRDCRYVLTLELCMPQTVKLYCPRCEYPMYCRCSYCHMPFIKQPRWWRPTKCHFCGIKPHDFSFHSLADYIPSRRFDVFKYGRDSELKMLWLRLEERRLS